MIKTQNCVQLIGYLGDDPYPRTSKKGATFFKFRMATISYRKNENGDLQRNSIWHTILVSSKLAADIPNEFIKGSHVLVQGEIMYDHYTDAAGIDRHFTEIRAQRIMNLDR